MTIVASVKARDGIVLATDSMVQLARRDDDGKLAISKTYQNAKKLFRIMDLPIGVMSFGLGNMGTRSVENLILEFSRDLGKYADNQSVETVARGLYKFLKIQYDEVFSGVPIAEQKKFLKVGFYIGGYSPNSFLAEEYEFALPDDEDIKQVRPIDRFGVSWRGIGAPFHRLFNGFDMRIAKAMKDEGVKEDVIKKVLGGQRWQMPVAYDSMPVQDAINFAVYILETTIGAVTIELNPAPACGGSLQVAVILPDKNKGWQWIKEPQLTIE